MPTRFARYVDLLIISLKLSNPQNPIDFLVVEAADRVGGRLFSHQFEGHTFEFGANWVQGLQSQEQVSPIWELAKQVQLKGWRDSPVYEVKDPDNQNPKDVKRQFERVEEKLDTAYSKLDKKIKRKPLKKDKDILTGLIENGLKPPQTDLEKLALWM